MFIGKTALVEILEDRKWEECKRGTTYGCVDACIHPDHCCWFFRGFCSVSGEIPAQCAGKFCSIWVASVKFCNLGPATDRGRLSKSYILELHALRC